ncbi:MAG: hypothetical protein ABR915_24695 [Thermoguttaceae bacterium]
MNYQKADVSEQQLEDLVRRYTGMIEEGLVYVDHQKTTDRGRLDVLMVDSDKSLVVAELKVVEDDGMLLQGLDYYDYVSAHVETYARLYKEHSIDAKREVRFIAPSYSQTLISRCRWLSLEPSLFTFTCIRFDGQDEPVPIFSEQPIPTPPPPPTTRHPTNAWATSRMMRCGAKPRPSWPKSGVGTPTRFRRMQSVMASPSRSMGESLPA